MTAASTQGPALFPPPHESHVSWRKPADLCHTILPGHNPLKARDVERGEEKTAGGAGADRRPNYLKIRAILSGRSGRIKEEMKVAP